MGNYKFRLSDMIPNAWFHKLRDMGKTSRNQSVSQSVKKSSRTTTSTTPKRFPSPQTKPSKTPQHFSIREERTEQFSNSPIHSKASDTHFPIDPPRISKRRTRRSPIRPSTKLVTSSVSTGCRCPYTVPRPSPESPLYLRDDYQNDDDLHNPIIFSKFKDLDAVSELDLPPILTKPAKKEAQASKFDDRNVSLKERSYHNSNVLEEQNKSPGRRIHTGIPRLKVSPRLANKKIQTHRNRKSVVSTAAMRQRKGLSESFAIVKSSSNPRRDFRESMVEMIVENNIRASKDLEELLASYLSLNSDEYHDLIVKVFQQIWFDLTDIRL